MMRVVAGWLAYCEWRSESAIRRGHAGESLSWATENGYADTRMPANCNGNGAEPVRCKADGQRAGGSRSPKRETQLTDSA